MSRQELIAGSIVVVLVAAVVLWWAPRSTAPRPLMDPVKLLVDGPDDPTVDAVQPPPPDLPSVVLVVGCTVRRDQLSPYGGPPELTPVLSRLAEGGVRFDDMITAAPWTKPAVVSLITGHHPLSVGMADRGRGRSNLVLSPGAETLAERLWAVGYETLGVSANPNLNVVFGLAQGFDRYADSDGRIRKAKVAGTEAVRRALALMDLRDAPERPFFLQLNLSDTHAPRAATVDEQESIGGIGVDPKLASYRVELHRLDAAIGKLFEGLRAREHVARDLVFVFVADHGEGLQLFEKHKAHGKGLYESQTRVPWILRGPGVAEGHVVNGLASSVDVLPTLLGVLGMPDRALPGYDWSALVRGEGDRTTRQRAVSDTWFYDTDRAGIWTADGTACLHDFGSAKRSMELFTEGCFDRAADPGFERPVQNLELMGELAAWRTHRLAELAGWDHPVEAALDEDVEEELGALGYGDE